jgi:hypothetical protein
MRMQIPSTEYIGKSAAIYSDIKLSCKDQWSLRLDKINNTLG